MEREPNEETVRLTTDDFLEIGAGVTVIGTGLSLAGWASHEIVANGNDTVIPLVIGVSVAVFGIGVVAHALERAQQTLLK